MRRDQESNTAPIRSHLCSARDVLETRHVTIRGDLYRCIFPNHENRDPSVPQFEWNNRPKCHGCDIYGDANNAPRSEFLAAIEDKDVLRHRHELCRTLNRHPYCRCEVMTIMPGDKREHGKS